MRYEVKVLDNRWAVWDTETGSPTSVAGRWQTGMTMSNARKVCQRLNRSESGHGSESWPPPEEELGGGDICSPELGPSTDDDEPL
jgi:hypothetical protein